MKDKILIIAEAGVNNNGSLEMAYRMVDAAKAAGADIVKFQTGKPENVVSRFAEKAAYQKQTTGGQESQLDMVRKLMMPFEAFVPLKAYCEKKQIGFLSTPFDIDSIHFLNDLQSYWKVPSGEITNLPYLLEIAKTHKPVILSTGMADMAEVKAAVQVLQDNGAGEITLLHCNTQYPTPFEDVNLRAMTTLQAELCLPVGFSDHTPGIEVPIAAAALGARVIEKHFTLDRNLPGPDHKASLEPDELQAMITGIRHVELAMGDGRKHATPSETPNKAIARKSIVAKRAIKAGEILTEDNITTKRPGNGVSPMRWFEVLGTAAVRDFAVDELIEL